LQVEITQRAEDDEDEDDEDDDESVAGPSQLAIPRPDPFDLLVTEDIPVDPSLVPPSSESDDDDSDGDPDPDELSSVDGDASDGEGPPSAAKEALERERKRIALKAMRAKLDGMLCSFFEHLEECMGGRVEHPPAAELAAATLTAASSGTSTPTSEIPTPLSSAPSLVARRPPPTPAQSLAHFQTLLNLFSRQILPTSSTQHIPFLLFLTSSFSPAHTDLFLGLLVSQALYATSTTAPTLNSQPISIGQRVAATVYIGSVVCRARFVTDDQARQVITYLLAWIEGKLHQTRTTRQTDELPLFYAVCQAVMLIFCFRWRAFTGTNPEHEGVLGEMELETEGESVEDGEAGGSGGDGKWMRDLDVLQRAITSELNPLLGCNPTIVSMFAKVAHQTGFAYCFSIIEANTSAARSTSSHALNRVASASTSAPSQGQSTTNSGTAFSSSASISASASDRESGRGRVNSVAAAASAGSASVTLPRQARQTNVDSGLDSYFPFDPYDLVRSNRWIESKYRTWDEVAMGADSDDEDDDDDEEDESEDEEEDVSEDSELENRLGSGLGGNKTSLPKAMTMPKSTPSSWDRRRWLKDNGLSSSLEGMSISPNVSGFAR
jgi:RNA polymerase I-specific transcription initiation factor RRN3